MAKVKVVAKTGLVPVKFLKVGFRGHRVDETAGFPPAVATDLIAKKVAEPVKIPDKVDTAEVEV